MSEVLNLRFGWLNPIFLSHISAFLLLTLKFPCVCFLHSLFLRLNPNSCSWKSAKKKYYSVKSQLNSSICWLLYPQFTYKSVIFSLVMPPVYHHVLVISPVISPSRHHFWLVNHHQNTSKYHCCSASHHQNNIFCCLKKLKQLETQICPQL